MNLFVTDYSRKILLRAILATLLMVLYAQFVLGYFSACFRIEGAAHSPGLLFGYTEADLLSFFSVRDSSQLLCYSDFLIKWDFIFPFIYSLMHICWLKYFYKSRYVFLLIPVLHMCADWTENWMEWKMISAYLKEGEIPGSLIRYGSSITILKWIFSYLTYLLITIGLGAMIWKYASDNKNEGKST